MSRAEILVVDDDPRLREVVRYALSREGFSVREAADGAQALAYLERQPREPDLMVLDVNMPELDGMDLCRAIRRRSELPIVFLSSRGDELDRVLGLELGGDDYITKPFSTRELVSRIKAVLRRTRRRAESGEEEALLRAGRLCMDTARHRVYVGDEEVGLTVTEFRILQVLLRRPGRVYTRDELAERAYPGRHHVSERTLDSHVRRIRQKMRPRGLDPVETVHGLGYRLRAD